MKEELHKLLSLANVCAIYIVDDAIGDGTVTYEHFIGLVKRIQNDDKLEELDKIDEGLEFSDNEAILDEYTEQIWENIQPDKQLQYVRKSCKIAKSTEGQDLATNLDIIRVLKQLNEEDEPHKLKLTSLSPIQWDKEVNGITSQIPEGQKALVLFDQVLNRAGGRFSVKKGIDLVEEVVNSQLDKVFITGILTYTVTNEGLEIPERTKLAKESSLDVSKVFVLTKERLEDLPRFVDGVKKLLLNEPCEQIKEQAILIGQDALGNTKEKILNLDTYDFSHTVLKSSFNEGVWAPETLFRIIDVIYKNEIKEVLLKKDTITKLNSLLSKANNINQVDIPVDMSEVYTERYALRKQEIFSDGRLINGLFKPIENGDIFEVTDGTGKGLYILLSQPCDLMIRSSGERGIRAGNLLKIGLFTNDKLTEDLDKKYEDAKAKKLHKFNYWETRGIIEYIEEDPKTIGLVSMPRAHVVNLDILDLTMFDSKGVAKLDVTGANPSTLHIGLAQRFSVLKANHEKLHVRMAEYTKLLKDIRGQMPKQILQELIPTLSLGDKLAKSSLSDTTFSYGIKRVKALRDPYAKNLLDKYTRYLSRTGNLHDFA
jgi:hypothetical protein